MRGDDQVADAIGQSEGELDGLAGASLPAIEDHADGGRVRRAGLEGLVNGNGKSLDAMIVEQVEQLVNGACQTMLALGEADEKLLSSGHEAHQAVLSAVEPGQALGLSDGGGMGGIFDDLVALERARMRSDLAGAVDDSDPFEIGHQQDLSADEFGRHAVAIAIEAHLGGRADGDGELLGPWIRS